MSVKIAAAETRSLGIVEADEEGVLENIVRVREYEKGRDEAGVEELEKRCDLIGAAQIEKGRRKQPSIVTDLMGDPICRIRNFSSHIMLVAEYIAKERCCSSSEIVGVIRGCMKYVTPPTAGGGNSKLASSTHDHQHHDHHHYVKMACVLGLRVSAAHRRLGIGTKLVQQLEEWSRQNGADYIYMATECNNQASINLFTLKCSYTKFRTPTVLVRPVHAHHKPLSPGIALVRVPPELAEPIYRHIFSNSEFFPKDIDKILNNKLNLGTFMAVPKKCLSNWDPYKLLLPSSFAILSIWNTKKVYKLKFKGVSSLKYACCRGSRILDVLLPCLRLPSVPNLFKHFGFYFLFGLHIEGPDGGNLMKSLCDFAHNMASDDKGCGLLVAEMGHKDPFTQAIPHWTKLSWDDLWCIKKLTEPKEEAHYDCGQNYWIKSQASPPPLVTFVDPRDF